MSSTNIPNRPAGAATAMGFVPRSRSRDRVGATSGDALVSVIPMKPRDAARIEYQPAIPKWLARWAIDAASPRSLARSIASSIRTRPACGPQPSAASHRRSTTVPPSREGRAAVAMTEASARAA